MDFIALYLGQIAASHRTLNIQICSDRSRLPPQGKSKPLDYLVTPCTDSPPTFRRRKPFDSPSAPVRAADYKLMAEFDAL